MPYASKEKANECRRRMYAKRRQALVDALGGACLRCGSTENLTIEHVDGRDYNIRKLSCFQRVKKYMEELRSGVRLCLYCLECNSSYGNYWSRFYEEAWAERMEAAGAWPPKLEDGEFHGYEPA